MPADLDSVVDRLLASYSQVEPRPEAVQAWLDRASEPAPGRRWRLPAPAWAALAVTLALLLVLGVAWLRGRNHNPSRPTLAQHERTTLVPAASQAPLTDEQKQLIQILQANPSALATMKPGQVGNAATQPPKKEKHP